MQRDEIRKVVTEQFYNSLTASGVQVTAIPSASVTPSLVYTPPPAPSVPFEIAPNGGKRGNPNLREVKTLRMGPPRYPIDAMPASYEQTQIRF